MKRIPNYALYGESANHSPSDLVHLEWLPVRAQALGGEIAAHHHSHLLQWLYIQRGRGEVQIETRWRAFQAPCLILLPCHTVHAFRTDADTYGPVVTAAQQPLESMLRILAPQLLPRLQQPLLLALPSSIVGSESFWPTLLQLADELNERRADYAAAASALLLTLLVQVERLIIDTRLPDARPARHLSLQQGFRDLVELHFRQHWRLDLYAERLGVSSGKLARICREELGESPLSLINARVMREAQRQLAHSDASIKKIAHGLGFRDLSYFSRYFRKHSGLRPGEFRAALQRQRLLGNAPTLETEPPASP